MWLVWNEDTSEDYSCQNSLLQTFIKFIKCVNEWWVFPPLIGIAGTDSSTSGPQLRQWMVGWLQRSLAWKNYYKEYEKQLPIHPGKSGFIERLLLLMTLFYSGAATSEFGQWTSSRVSTFHHQNQFRFFNWAGQQIERTRWTQKVSKVDLYRTEFTHLAVASVIWNTGERLWYTPTRTCREEPPAAPHMRERRDRKWSHIYPRGIEKGGRKKREREAGKYRKGGKKNWSQWSEVDPWQLTMDSLQVWERWALCTWPWVKALNVLIGADHYRHSNRFKNRFH